MNYFVDRANVKGMPKEGHITYPMLDNNNGCKAGFCSGITFYHCKEYSLPGVHDDQEGFVVIEGKGWAKVGKEEFRIKPDISFIAPAGVKHSVKCDPDSKYVKLCWFHGAIK